jgi:NAD(P)-dependent dehydrogenase (short-subunit alcohol dehydrogenase family)
MAMSKVAIVTGGSSGIGLCAALCLRDAGCTVYELSRREPEALPGVTHIKADVTDKAQVSAAVQQVLDQEGRVDILISNAGYGISGAVEFTSPEDAKKQLDVNFFGMVNIVTEVLPIMRQQGGGRIVAVSSVAGILPIPFQTYYSVSKAAINSFVMALQNEVKPFGIGVCAVMPGDIKTGFTAAREKLHEDGSVYAGRIEKSVRGMEKDEQGGMSPETAGRFLCRVALKRTIHPLYIIGGKYKLFGFLAHVLPAPPINYILGRLYAS